MKLTLKLLIVIAIVVALAGLCGGWKWDGKPSKRKAADYALLADPNSSILNTSIGAPPPIATADPTVTPPSTSTDPSITPAPTDPDISNASADIPTTDGWTWD